MVWASNRCCWLFSDVRAIVFAVCMYVAWNVTLQPKLASMCAVCRRDAHKGSKRAVYILQEWELLSPVSHLTCRWCRWVICITRDVCIFARECVDRMLVCRYLYYVSGMGKRYEWPLGLTGKELLKDASSAVEHCKARTTNTQRQEWTTADILQPADRVSQPSREPVRRSSQRQRKKQKNDKQHSYRPQTERFPTF